MEQLIFVIKIFNLCNKCPASIRGRCCYFTAEIIDNNRIHLKISLSKHPCKYLNTKPGRCNVYKKRYEMNPNCLTIKEMILIGTIHKECLYVKNNQEYQRRKDTVLLKLPSNISEYVRKKYEELNSSPHSQVATYDTLRTHLCPKCESPNLKEEWDDKFSLSYFSYQCENCGYEWNNLKKQFNYTFKKIKEVD
ncbi:hypothetical protein LCGC14_1183790 [marine sediment metagenome]|uniref:Uncharacterized protein n=1 Tax=marine sediment metagenome TaxID=412755 RepID=A0A0F9M967_9ZZZZ